MSTAAPIPGLPMAVVGGAAQPWPVTGCQCVLCVAGPDAAGTQTSALRVGRIVTLSGDSRLDVAGAPGGARLEPGQTRSVSGVRLLSLPRPLVPALVVGAAGATVLWAPGPGPLGRDVHDAVAGAGLDAAVLDLRGPQSRPDPVGLAHDLATLRRTGAVREGADVVAVGLSHEVGDLDRLRRRLAAWGVRIADPGDVLRVDPNVPPVEVPAAPRRTLVLGAAASGKSVVAEELLAAEPAVLYLATAAQPDPGDQGDQGDQGDEEWSARIRRHRDRRPDGWTTIESADPAGWLTSQGPAVLLDSLGTWVTAALGRSGAWDDESRDDRGWSDRFEREVEALLGAWRATQRRVVAVAEETGWGVVPPTIAGRRFRDALGSVTRRLADQSERVLLVVAGRVVDLDTIQ